MLLLGTLLYSVLGSAAGFLAGLLGIGGGIIVVPGLAFLFTSQAISSTVIMQLAAGTSLAAILFTMAAAVFAHRKNKLIAWSIVWQMLPGTIVGTMIGVYIADLLPTHTLKIIFGVFLALSALQLFLKKSTPPTTEIIYPRPLIQKAAGLGIGILAGLLGVGGGVLAVPILLRFGLPPHNASATSSACSLFLSISGMLSFMVAGWNNPVLPIGSTGYIYWPAVLAIAVTSILFVPLGAKLAKRLSGDMLQRVFAIFLFIVAIVMVV